MPAKHLLLFTIGLCVLFPCLTSCKRETATKEFTEKDIAEVQTVLRDLDPKRYRMVLPEFSNGRVVGSKTYGSLPITEVRRIASVKGINYVETGNVQMIFADEGGGAGSHTESQSAGEKGGSSSGEGGSSGSGGAGSHTESQSAGSRHAEAIRRIENIVLRIDKSQYVFIR